jgi:hypothetical protein
MRVLFGAMLLAGLAVCLQQVSANGTPRDSVADREAATVVGGGCVCWSIQNCSQGTNCTGSCYKANTGSCLLKGDTGINNGVCGGGCTDGYANNTTGCG